jgi:hypothetical protein
MSKNNKLNKSRRDFTKRLALISAAPALTTFCTTTSSQTVDVESVSSDVKDLAKAKLKALSDLLQQQYGQHIQKENIPDIEAMIARNLAHAETLKSIKLKNSDEPTTIFRA